MTDTFHLNNSVCFREIKPHQPLLTSTCKAEVDVSEFRESSPLLFGPEGKPQNQKPWKLPIMPLVAASPILSLCHKHLGFLGALMFTMRPRSVVPMHIDSYRNVSLNMLIDGWDSHTLFVNHLYFTELKYKPHKLYVYNASISHQVVNFDNYRYLLSVSFQRMISYLDVVKFLESHNLLVSIDNED